MAETYSYRIAVLPVDVVEGTKNIVVGDHETVVAEYALYDDQPPQVVVLIRAQRRGKSDG